MKKILLLLTILFALPVFSQTEEAQRQLEEKKAKLQEELAKANQKFATEKKKEKTVLKEIAKQDFKINITEKIINTTAKQKRLLSDDIYLTQLDINKYKQEIEELKADYAKMIVKSYKSRSEQSKAMFVLSSDNFTQAYKRVQYMKQYAGYRKRQAEEIRDKQSKLENSKDHLEVKKKEKEKIIVASTKEQEGLEKEKTEKERLVKLIQKDKKKIAAEIAKIKKESKEIDRKIRKMIADAIAAINKKNAEKKKAAAGNTTPTTKADPVSSTKIELTPEGKIVSNNFKANKGSLPWPVEKGVITLGYGNQPHPLQKDIIVHNSGIEITTDAGASARAVFAGEVSNIQVSQNTGLYTVLVAHGDYFTVYSNLSSVSVSKGSKVSEKQSIGKIKTNANGKTVLKFLVNQNTTTLNPKTWIAAK
jgi:murein hydrolase activator